MGWKNRQSKGEGVLPLILVWLAIAAIVFVIFLLIMTGILWFVEWLPIHCGWVGVLIVACVVSYLVYKYA